MKMELSWKVYGVLIGVAVGSFVAATYLPTSQILRDLASIPGIGALAGVVYEIFRDQWVHERTLALQRQQQDFVVGVASHMAGVVYDRHVAFCEAYLSRTTEGILNLVSTGPSKDALALSSDLAGIRFKHAAWLSDDVERKLLPFENALRRIGALDGYIPSVTQEQARNRLVKEMYDSFGIVLGLDKPLTEEQAQTASSRIFDHLRDLLGISQLTKLRQLATEEALIRSAEGNRQA